MSTTTSATRRKRRLVSMALAVLAAGIAGIAALTLAPADASSGTTARAATSTYLTLNVHNCDGCRVTLYQGDWHSRNALVQDGRAVFHVATSHTKGMSIGITGPWEATSPHPSGFTSMVAMRYAWAAPNGTISYADAVRSHKGSACWSGTSAHRQSLSIQARKVVVDGTTGPAYSTLAWASPSRQTVHGTLQPVDRGVYGTQAVPDC